MLLDENEPYVVAEPDKYEQAYKDGRPLVYGTDSYHCLRKLPFRVKILDIWNRSHISLNYFN